VREDAREPPVDGQQPAMGAVTTGAGDYPILAVGFGNRGPWVQALRSVSAQVEAQQLLERAYGEARRHRPLAIALKGGRTDLDPLETVLMMRDLDGNVPIVIAGPITSQLRRALSQQPQTHLVESPEDFHSVLSKLMLHRLKVDQEGESRH
jgi:hypothetical protein